VQQARIGPICLKYVVTSLNLPLHVNLGEDNQQICTRQLRNSRGQPTRGYSLARGLGVSRTNSHNRSQDVTNSHIVPQPGLDSLARP
jgi:hypothetical protein